MDLKGFILIQAELLSSYLSRFGGFSHLPPNLLKTSIFVVRIEVIGLPWTLERANWGYYLIFHRGIFPSYIVFALSCFPLPLL